MNNTLKNRLKYHVTGAIERGEAQAIVEKTTLHTPSPWHLHKSESDFVIVHSEGENRSHVAKLFDSTLCEEHGSLAANARLIAAAPDLLSALESAYNAIAWDIPGGNLSDDDEEELLDTVRAAIAKAKGAK